jgi:hypothetical protein
MFNRKMAAPTALLDGVLCFVLRGGAFALKELAYARHRDACFASVTALSGEGEFGFLEGAAARACNVPWCVVLLRHSEVTSHQTQHHGKVGPFSAI